MYIQGLCNWTKTFTFRQYMPAARTFYDIYERPRLRIETTTQAGAEFYKVLN
jgi:hypothetical protein